MACVRRSTPEQTRFDRNFDLQSSHAPLSNLAVFGHLRRAHHELRHGSCGSGRLERLHIRSVEDRRPGVLHRGKAGVRKH